MMVSTPISVPRADGYMITYITADGEQFGRLYFPTELEKLKAFTEKLQRRNECLQIKISTYQTVVTLERATIGEPYSYLRTIGGKTQLATIDNIQMVYAPKKIAGGAEGGEKK